ncbi:MAG: DUF924 domain-containing protein [Gammaproteobacteria bacterium]|jgi:uncharacterized protein (DUF924 family)|nr:DUF924 domain-containing protein [Gammaproteobacteria bacterium]MBT5202189.1 DUF924 domain-containing protein [Gammaproteobacteria bacterium]MBT5600669.1 DUF924 domain-containing protein [Gammaproteobacteria bacterium]MBT6247513.1 DUF924 domain-containing protein [Gammaproteobacteria bacterium]
MRLVSNQIDSDIILDYWLGPARYHADALKKTKQRWYRHGKRLDAPIKAQFGDLLKALSQSKSTNRDTVQLSTAKVIILDQFSRHIFRGRPQAWANDLQAQQLSLAELNSAQCHHLTPSEQLFLWHPFHHSEEISLQRLGLSLLEQLLTSITPEWQRALQGFLPNWQSHAAIIAKFGRFPHRNNLLGRVSSKKELLYLDQQRNHYGQD